MVHNTTSFDIFNNYRTFVKRKEVKKCQKSVYHPISLAIIDKDFKLVFYILEHGSTQIHLYIFKCTLKYIYIATKPRNAQEVASSLE